MFPEEFDPVIYGSHKDLSSFSIIELINHYNLHGKNEGRKCNLVNRNFISKLANSLGECLEIGPFDCPVLEGNNVKYFDILDKELLMLRAESLQRKGKVPFIDFVDSEGNLDSINLKFNTILSCHSIEHQINFIGHLKNVENLLLNDGYYIIICPDKRYCFDHFIKESTIADIIESEMIPKTKHSIKSVIEHICYTCHNDCVRHWNNDHGQRNLNLESLNKAISEYNTGKYIDVHAWQFTPDSFQEIINILNKMNYISLKVHKIYPTIRNSNEFICILQKA